MRTKLIILSLILFGRSLVAVEPLHLPFSLGDRPNYLPCEVQFVAMGQPEKARAISNILKTPKYAEEIPGE